MCLYPDSAERAVQASSKSRELINLGNEMFPLHWRLVVIALFVVARGQFDLFVWNLSIWDHAQKMGDAVEPRSLFVVRSNNMPWSMLAVGGL